MLLQDETKDLRLPPGITVRHLFKSIPGTWNSWTKQPGFLGLDWSPDGRQLATTLEGTIQLWDVVSGELAAAFGSHYHPVRALAWSPDGATLAVLSSGALCLWDVARQSLQTSFSIDRIGERPESLTWSPDGSKIAIAGHHPRIIELGHEPVVRMMEHFSNWTEYITWSPDGAHIAAYYSTATVVIWGPDAALRHKLTKLPTCYSLAWSRDSRMLLLGGTPIFCTWNVRTKLVDIALPKMKTTNALSCSADGRLLALRSFSTIMLLTYGDWRELATLDLYYAEQGTICFSPTGHAFATLHGETRHDRDLLIHIFDVDLNLLTGAAASRG